MLFDSAIEPSCSYCRFGTALGQNEIACYRRGIMAGSGFCGSFRYEPTKRIPVILPQLDISGLSEKDFSL